jgi:O-acetyl-ADP-ribose deacetylase (regulator of RNase III)
MPARIEVLDADVTRLEVDAIANAANTRLHHGGGVALAIAEGAGEALITESEQRAPIGLGEAIETAGGDLPARWVIHAATMHPDGRTGAAVISKATAATLERAEALEVRSLALVAFGTGVGGFPVDQAAELMVAEVTRHLAAGSGLERVVFAVRGDEAREAFERAVREDGS